MNCWQIAGGFISILGTILMFYGSHLQGLGDKKFQGKVGEYVESRQAEDTPQLVALTVKAEYSDFLLTVKNIGRKPATKVKVIFSEKSTPSAFAGNLISGATEIPQDTEYTFSLNLFTGINQIMQLPNSKPGYKEALETSLQKFNAGQIAFIPRFHLEYYHGETKLVSPTYYLVLERQRGLLSFGKEG